LLPCTGCILKESVKILPAKTPTPPDKATLQLAASDVLANGSRIQAKSFGHLCDCEKTFVDGRVHHLL